MGLYEYEKRHNRILRKLGAECTVLLKKDGSFPIEKGADIALYGSGARNTVKGGTGSGEVNSRFYVSIEKGLKRAGFNITTEKWLDEYDRIKEKSYKEFINSIKREAKGQRTPAVFIGMGRVMPEPEYSLPIDGSGDTAIYVLSRISGEGSDREVSKGDILLSDTELRDIRLCNEIYKNFMLVLNVGGVVDIHELSDIKNILLLSQLGVKTGDTFADIILGRSTPSGKLATTWACREDYQKIGDFGDKDDTDYREGIYVGYRYFDSVNRAALYPFGFGLSYTEFDIEYLGTWVDEDKVTVKANVSNKGAFSGKEVVQAYVSIPEGKLDEPYQVLAGFQKTGELKPGDKEIVEISFSLRDIAPYSEADSAYILEAGKYYIRLGNSSKDTVTVSALDLDSEVIVEKVQSAISAPGFTDWKPGDILTKDASRVLPSVIDIIKITAENVPTKEISYKLEYNDIDDDIRSMPIEKLIKASLGSYSEKMGGFASIIGNAGQTVAGAAGQTCMELGEYGISSLVMADGPAGVRLTKHFVKDGEKAHGLGDAALPQSVLVFLPKPAKVLMKVASYRPPKGAKIRHQYATAIPIGTAIAQSFDIGLAETLGDIVGEEMEMFGVHLWLAPALNIHRSIRCGRNFEYYSEDPLVSGLMSAAVTRGVQRHKNCGTTIKHFAGNNQEYNRTQNSSNMSERAFREIYLKGFKICIRDSHPKAVMTSYNLINGVHTSESMALTEDVLRCECGHKGLIMTDWVVQGFGSETDNKYPVATAPKVIMAGGNLFMPGTKADYNDVLKAFKEGYVTKERLLINVWYLKKGSELL